MNPENGSPMLRAQERIRIFPPRKFFEELMDKAVQAWQALKDRVQISGLAPERLVALVKAARDAQETERKSAILYKENRDARIQANQEAYKALRKLRRVAIALGKDDALVAESFKFLAEAFALGPKAPAAETPVVPEPDKSNG